VCAAEDPLLVVADPETDRLHCRACGGAITSGALPSTAAPSGHLVIEIERMYIRSLGGIDPDPEVCGEISSRQFSTLIESLALLFSSRLPNETHIFAALMLDAETANCYFRGRGKAEAMLTYFSWKWRFLVMLGIVKVIFGPANSSPKPASTAERTRLFFDLLKAIPAKDRSFVLRASEPWPELLQEPLWAAVKLLEGSAWNSAKSLRFRCQGDSLN